MKGIFNPTYKDNLKALLADSLTLKPTLNDSLEGLLEKKALCYGQSMKEIKMVVTIKTAIERLLNKYAEEDNFTNNKKKQK